MIYRIMYFFPNFLNIGQSIKKVLSVGSRAILHHDTTSGMRAHNSVASLPTSTILQTVSDYLCSSAHPTFQERGIVPVAPGKSGSFCAPLWLVTHEDLASDQRQASSYGQ